MLRYIFPESSQLFGNASAQRGHYYSHLIVENSALERLVNKSFENFLFLAITIRHHYYLSQLELDTFVPSNHVTTVLKFDSNRNLGSSERSVESLFAVISTFTSLETLIIAHCGLSYIPSNAFKSASTGTSLPIRKLLLMNNQIKEIHANAFVDLPFVQRLYLSNNDITWLRPHSLRLRADQCRHSTHHHRQIHYWVDLNANQLNSDSFQSSTFDVDCPVEVNLSNNSIHYLAEPVFKPLFTHYARILLHGNPVDCHHCAMVWLLKGNFCSRFNSTLKYQSLVESICETISLADFIYHCEPFRSRLKSHQAYDSSRSPDQLVTEYLHLYPDDLTEPDNQLLQCPYQGEDSSAPTLHLPMLLIAILLSCSIYAHCALP